MVTKVTKSDIESYYDRDIEDIFDISNKNLLFEAMSEKIVEQNSNYEISSLAQLYDNSDKNLENFVEYKLKSALSKDLLNFFNENKYHKNWIYNRWVSYTKKGILESLD